MVNHEIVVRGFGLAGEQGSTPAILTMADSDFPTRMFSDLGEPANNQIGSVRPAAPQPGEQLLHLLQPVQRVLQSVLVDLSCAAVGAPRLDPRRVESAGLVIRRRVRRDDGTDDPNALEGWMRTPQGKGKWARLNQGDDLLDPDPARRPTLLSGQPELDKMLTAHLAQTQLSESTSPAFIAPPALCDRLGKTLLYALIPTASSEVTSLGPLAPEYDGEVLRKQLPALLRSGSPSVPLASQNVHYRYMSVEYCRTVGAPTFVSVINLLYVLGNEFDAFGSGALALKMRTALNRRSVTFSDNSRLPFGDFLQRLQAALLTYTPEDGPHPVVTMPASWDPVSGGDEAAVLLAAEESLRARSRALAVPAGRYQDHTRTYRLRLFLRVRGHENCPARTLWSELSEPFEIAPWYESAGLVGPPVPLPKPSRAFFKKAKPNVAFVVPGSLMEAMQNSTLKGLTAGDVGVSADFGLTWICGFSIPIITICAFFVLNIFLILLNLVFFWLPFIKVCIPFPSKAAPSLGGDK